jgi:hypothetical protein
MAIGCIKSMYTIVCKTSLSNCLPSLPVCLSNGFFFNRTVQNLQQNIQNHDHSLHLQVTSLARDIDSNVVRGSVYLLWKTIFWLHQVINLTCYSKLLVFNYIISFKLWREDTCLVVHHKTLHVYRLVLSNRTFMMMDITIPQINKHQLLLFFQSNCLTINKHSQDFKLATKGLVQMSSRILALFKANFTV